MKGLTEKQKAILDFIEDFQESNGMPPTVQEIADRFQVKSSTIFAHLRALQRKNQLERSAKARSIVLRNTRTPMHRLPGGIWKLPLLGRVSAGEPAESLQYKEGEFCIPVNTCGLTRREGAYALRVQGESMRDLGIMDGDVVIVAPMTEPPVPGDVVVAVIQGGECTVKTYQPGKGNTIELHPANPNYSVQIYDIEDVKLQGKVVCLTRDF